MAKENTVLLYGRIERMQIPKNDEGKWTRATFNVRTLRRPILGADKLSYDIPLVLTKNPILIDQIIKEEIGSNTMVEIKGVLCTLEVIKSSNCSHCKTKNSVKGNLTFVNPIYIEKREVDVDDEHFLEIIRKKTEVSNDVKVIGNLCADPKYYESAIGGRYAQFQLAVNRKYRILEQPEYIKTDYPIVKTYGEQAYQDSMGLHTGSTIYIDGALQTRNFLRTTVCEHCGCEYEWNSAATDIVPYSIEYLANCVYPEGKAPEDEVFTREMTPEDISLKIGL